MSEQNKKRIVEEPVDLGPTNHEAESHADQTPGQQTPEKKSEQVYAGIVDRYIESFAGNVSDEERPTLQAELLEHIKNIDVQTQDELVKAYEEVISGLQQYAEARLTPEERSKRSEAKAEAAASDTNENDSEPIVEETAGKRRNFLMRAITGANRWSGGKILMAQSWMSEKSAKRANKYIQQENESDEEYDKRMRRVGARVNLAVMAIGGAFLGYQASRYLGVDINPFDNGGAGNPNTSGDKSVEDTLPVEGDTDHDGKISPQEALELANASRLEESEFLNTNGRKGNDFNDISGDKLRNTMLGENGEVVDNPDVPAGFDALMDQYNASPRELAAQLDQFRDLNVPFPADIAELNRLPGEEYDAYIDRITDAMHNNQELHDQAVQFAGDQLADKEAVALEGPYRAAYIVPDGKGGHIVKWDGLVESPDPNDQIIMLGDGKGIRLPCGQPIELIPQEAPVSYGQQPVGQGGAPVYSPTHNNPPGIGGETPPTPEKPTTPETPTPEIPEEPESEGKDWNKVPDPVDGGVTQLPLDESVTPKTEQATPGDNGTGQPDFMPGTPGSTPGSETSPEVTAPGANTGETNNNDNAPQPGVNGTGPNGTINPDNI